GSAPGLCATALASCAVFFFFKDVISIPLASQSMFVLFVMLLLVVNFAFHKVHLKNAELILKNAALAELRTAIEALNAKNGQPLHDAPPGTDSNAGLNATPAMRAVTQFASHSW